MTPNLSTDVDSMIAWSRLPAQPDQLRQERLFSPELAALAKAVNAADKDDQDRVFRMLSDAMPSMTPFKAAGLAIYFGAAVERGRDPLSTAPAVIGRLRDLLIEIARLPTTTEPSPRQKELSLSLQFVSQSAVSHLVRCRDVREKLAGDKDFVELLAQTRGEHAGPDWVYGVLSVRSGNLIVLLPESGSGFRIDYKNVGNNFHLFTLLQGVLGPRLGLDVAEHNEAIAAAGGSAPVHEKLHDQAMWNFCTYLNVGKKFNPLNFVWGEGSPDEIAELDGQKIVALLPLTMHRGWSSGFFGPQLQQCPPSVEVKAALPADEAAAWIHRAAVAASSSN